MSVESSPAAGPAVGRQLHAPASRSLPCLILVSVCRGGDFLQNVFRGTRTSAAALDRRDWDQVVRRSAIALNTDAATPDSEALLIATLLDRPRRSVANTPTQNCARLG